MPAQSAPNIIFIMGDDIGWFNIGAYHQGIMAGRTPNLDRLAAGGMRFTDYYAEASCTAGRANFITGELPIRTGLDHRRPGRRKNRHAGRSATIATALKAMGYATGQFGKNHLGDRNEFCRRSTDSTSSSAISTTSTPWKIPTHRNYPQAVESRPTQHAPLLGHRQGRHHRRASLGHRRQAKDRGRRPLGSQADGNGR